MSPTRMLSKYCVQDGQLITSLEEIHVHVARGFLFALMRCVLRFMHGDHPSRLAGTRTSPFMSSHFIPSKFCPGKIGRLRESFVALV